MEGSLDCVAREVNERSRSCGEGARWGVQCQASQWLRRGELSPEGGHVFVSEPHLSSQRVPVGDSLGPA